jgi:gamma-glutamylcyclotransferase (GGCT)/AIG2-like uncharacterized protein YtfP
MNSPLHVFVYGTLKPGEANFVGVASSRNETLRERYENCYCGNRVISIQRGYIQAELYHFPALGYPGAIHGASRVHGYVLTFADAEVLVKLDELEDYQPDRPPAQNEYTRELVSTYRLDGSFFVSAWVYFIGIDRIEQWGGILVPDGWWES